MQTKEIVRKLRLNQEMKILIINAPAEYLNILSALDFETDLSTKKAVFFDFVQVFSYAKQELEHQIKSVSMKGKYDCLFWVCYPKGSGKIQSDIKRNVVWEVLGTYGLRCVTQVSLNETWSALRVRPLEKIGK
jgi:hypothetical protein